MKINTVYKYKRNDGGITVSPDKPEGEYTEAYRISADEGKVLTKDGIELYGVIDTDTTDGWYEVDSPEEVT